MKLFKNNGLKISSLTTKTILTDLPSVLFTGVYFYLAVSIVNVANATETYLPDTVKLETKAAQSKDLYVEPDFNFDTFNTYTLELYVNDQDGEPAQGAILRVFSTNDENIQQKEGVTSQKSLLGIVRTDHYGRVYQTIEISQSVTQVLLELNSQSPDNQVLIKLADKEYISHVFEVD